MPLHPQQEFPFLLLPVFFLLLSLCSHISLKVAKDIHDSVECFFSCQINRSIIFSFSLGKNLGARTQFSYTHGHCVSGMAFRLVSMDCSFSSEISSMRTSLFIFQQRSSHPLNPHLNLTHCFCYVRPL